MAQPAQKYDTDTFNAYAEWFKGLQERITSRFEQLDTGGQFEVTPWTKGPDDMLQGNGEMRVMRGGVFEKVGVNFSNVHGVFSEEHRASIPGCVESGGQFRATGVSLVAHMASPLVPAVHMNVRRIETSTGWFGGGADLTPYFPFEEDTQSFHNHLKAACDDYRDGAYSEYKKWCDEYFFLPHRNEPRGVGGIFFDNLDSGNESADWSFVQNVGEAFLTAYSEIVARRKDLSWDEEQREHQLIRRGRYVEFNLLYDRGTKFGFASGGNAEAILMSMPPVVKWP